jgi:ATP-dependent Lon protease
VTERLLPLFPLPLVLFPGVLLPLHIFEPRYREMLADCLAGDRRFGIVFTAEGDDEGPQRGAIGCIARIQNDEKLPDGRSNILVQGEDRFAIARLVTGVRPYLLGEVVTYGDVEESPEPLESLAHQLRRVFERVGKAARALADDRDPLPALPDSPAALSFMIASLIDLDAAGRQRLLASRSPLGRLRELDALLSPAVEMLESRAVVHARAKTNGHGPGGAH